MQRAETRCLTRPHGRVRQRGALTIFVFVCGLAVPGLAQQRGYVQWPIGRPWGGTIVPGHNIESFLTYGTRVQHVDEEGETVTEVHGGIDLIWSTMAGADQPPDGTATFGAPVYAIADGKLLCENRGLNTYTDWPGRVIVIEHTLNGETFYSLYGHLRYPTGRDDRWHDPDAEDPWALPPFSTTSSGFRDGEPALYVRRGQQIGTVLKWRDRFTGALDPTNSHLHFEIRTSKQDGILGNCQGRGYTRTAGPTDRTEREEWLQQNYHWVNPVNFIFDRGQRLPLKLVTDSHTSLEVRIDADDDVGINLGSLPPAQTVRAFERKKDDAGNWWYRMLAVLRAPDGRSYPWLAGWIKAYKSKTAGTERKSEILASEIPSRPRERSTEISYSYSFNGVSGLASVPRGENFTIWKATGGCGPDFVDIALCQVSRSGRVRAYNHDCLSEEGPGTFGPWVRQGCSRAEEFGYEVMCCVE